MSIARWFIHIVITYDDDVTICPFQQKSNTRNFLLIPHFWPHQHKYISKNELKDDLEALIIIRM